MFRRFWFPSRPRRNTLARRGTYLFFLPSHWNNSVVSGVSGRIQPALRNRTAPIRWSLRQTPTRCRVGVRGRLVSSVSQRIDLTVTLATPTVKDYTPRILEDQQWKRRRRRTA